MHVCQAPAARSVRKEKLAAAKSVGTMRRLNTPSLSACRRRRLVVPKWKKQRMSALIEIYEQNMKQNIGMAPLARRPEPHRPYYRKAAWARAATGEVVTFRNSSAAY